MLAAWFDASAAPIRVLAQNTGWLRPSTCHPIASPVAHLERFSGDFVSVASGAVEKSCLTWAKRTAQQTAQ